MGKSSVFCQDTGSFHELNNQLYLGWTNWPGKTGRIFPGHPEFFRTARLTLPGWTNRSGKTGQVFPGHREFFSGSRTNFTRPGLTDLEKLVKFSPGTRSFSRVARLNLPGPD